MMETVLISFEEHKTEQNPAYRPAAKITGTFHEMSLHIFKLSQGYLTLNMVSSIGTSISITSNDITPASIPFILAIVFFGIITPLVSV